MEGFLLCFLCTLSKLDLVSVSPDLGWRVACLRGDSLEIPLQITKKSSSKLQHGQTNLCFPICYTTQLQTFADEIS